MKFYIFIFLFTFLSIQIHAQKMMVRDGKITFFSKAPIENIEATNSQALSVINLDNGDIVATVLMKSFQFEKALMQEHFNENYVESDKYPKAVFKGIIKDFNKAKMTSGIQVVTVSGTMEMHGVTLPFTATGKMDFKDGNLRITSTFPIKLYDYKIEIPKVVAQNIAETVDVSLDFIYKPVQP